MVALLERATPAESYEARVQAFQDSFHVFEDITAESVRKVLRGYRFVDAGVHVVLEAKRLIAQSGFNWNDYFEEADARFEDDFPNDKFLGIKFVGYKVRDFALNEFSDRFAAVDRHLWRVTRRTGLFMHGYGDLAIGEGDDYHFMRRLLLKLSRSTGWPAGGYSPGEIDRIFWFFGRAVCKAESDCLRCPVSSACLTAKRRAE